MLINKGKKGSSTDSKKKRGEVRDGAAREREKQHRGKKRLLFLPLRKGAGIIY